MNIKEARHELLKIAASMRYHPDMPSSEYSEWNWPKGMQKSSWRKVHKSAMKADERCRRWMIEISDIASNLGKDEQSNTKKEYGCYVECDEGPDKYPQPDCVLDWEGYTRDCDYSKEGMKKEDCKYWRPV